VERQVDQMGLVRCFTFLGEGCAELAWNACEALWLAGMPVTIANLLRFASSLPYSAFDLRDAGWQRTSFCNQCLKSAYERTPQQGEAHIRMEAVLGYFLVRFIRMPVIEQVTLLKVFVAFIGDTESEAGMQTGEYWPKFQPTDDMILGDGTEGADENEEEIR
jgi:hypothetical protein